MLVFTAGVEDVVLEDQSSQDCAATAVAKAAIAKVAFILTVGSEFGGREGLSSGVVWVC